MNLIFSKTVTIVFFIFIMCYRLYASESFSPATRLGSSLSIGLPVAVLEPEKSSIKAGAYTYDLLLLCKMRINKKFDIVPVIGFTKIVLNVSTHFYARRAYNFLVLRKIPTL